MSMKTVLAAAALFMIPSLAMAVDVNYECGAVQINQGRDFSYGVVMPANYNNNQRLWDAPLDILYVDVSQNGRFLKTVNLRRTFGSNAIVFVGRTPTGEAMQVLFRRDNVRQPMIERMEVFHGARVSRGSCRWYQL